MNGAQQTTASWHDFIRRFHSDLRIVAFDFPGVGRSRIDEGDPHLTFAEQVGIVEAVAAATHGGSVALFGASWGGLVAAAAAASGNVPVERLLLASFGVRPIDSIVRMIERGHEMFERGERAAVGQLMVEGFGAGLPEPFQRRIVEQFAALDETSVSALRRHADFVQNLEHAAEHVDFRAIEAPTLIVNGELDTIIDNADLPTIATQIPDAHAVVLPGLGHFLHQEVGGECVFDVYGDFLCVHALAA